MAEVLTCPEDSESLEFLILMTEHAVQVMMDDLSFLSCYVWYGEITGHVTDPLSGFIEEH